MCGETWAEGEAGGTHTPQNRAGQGVFVYTRLPSMSISMRGICYSLACIQTARAQPA